MTEQEALQVLNAIPGIGGAKIHGLMRCFGSALDVLKQGHDDHTATGLLLPNAIENIIHFPRDKFLSDENILRRQKNISIVTVLDDDYPHLLKQIPGAPAVLYILGDKNALHRASVAIVGSRQCSYYGKAQARNFANAFARAGVVVVSGLARGIDTNAHEGCLQAEGVTIAVLGCGLAHIYPKENQQLMLEVAKNGAVISELPLQTPAMPANFPRRNRIITGLSLATVVIEAGQRSGALISAGYALEQGREVFALPANIDYPTAMGSNQLLKDGAQLALAPRDVLEVFREQLELIFPEEITITNQIKIFLEPEEQSVYNMLTTEPLHIDSIAAQLNQPVGQIAQVVLQLQLKELAVELPGKYFIKA